MTSTDRQGESEIVEGGMAAEIRSLRMILERPRILKRAYEELTEKLSDLGHIHTTTRPDAASRRAELERRISRIENQQMSAADNAVRIINMITDPPYYEFCAWFSMTPPRISLKREQFLLRLRYLEVLDWPEVRRRMTLEGYRVPCTQTVQRWHRMMMEHLSVLETQMISDSGLAWEGEKTDEIGVSA